MSKQLTGNRLYIKIPKKTNPIDTYTKTQIDDLLNLKVDKVTLTDYMTIAAFLSIIDDYYTKTQINNEIGAINTRIGNLGSDITSIQSDVSYLQENYSTKSELSNYQLAESVNLDTSSNTIVDAINEVNEKANQSITIKASTLSATWDYSVVRSQGMIFSGEFLTPQILTFSIEVDLYQTSFTANVTKDIATSVKYTPYNGGTQQAMNDWTGSCILYHGSSNIYAGTYHINGAATLKVIFNSTFTTTGGDVLILYGIKPRL